MKFHSHLTKILCCLYIFIGILQFSAQAQPSADLVLTPSTSTPTQCDVFTVLVSVESVDTFNTVEALLNFDPNELQVVEVTAPDVSNVLTSNPPFDSPNGLPEIDNTNGSLFFVAGATTDITGDIDFIRIRFEVIGNGGTTSVTTVTSGSPRSRVVSSGFVDGIAEAIDILNDALPIELPLSPDTELPTFECVANTTRNTDSGTCSYTIQGTEFDPTNADDNCGVSTIVNNLNGTSTLAGETVTDGTSVTWTITDENGNSDECTFTITVIDNQPPQASCQNITVFLDENGMATANPADADNGSTDNCGIASFSLEQTEFTCANIGDNELEFFAFDEIGNAGICIVTVTVVDNTAPTAVCQNFTVQLDANGSGTLLSGDIDGGSTDNCGVESLSILGCPEDLAFDQNTTSDILFGDGNDNGAFTLANNGSIELALRAKVRFPSPANTFNSNGDGSYNHAVGVFGSGGVQSGWNFEWSVNTDADGASGLKLDDLTYEIGIDYDPTDGVNFVEFDPINQPFADHAIGDNSTANGAGAVAVDPASYASLIAANNVAQNSWRNNFFGAFDGNVDGRYEVYL
ncbi:MAG: HYR domain-containing protein, partial [Cryomorphaceae bacterium]